MDKTTDIAMPTARQLEQVRVRMCTIYSNEDGGWWMSLKWSKLVYCGLFVLPHS